jgi:hypothetical protein
VGGEVINLFWKLGGTGFRRWATEAYPHAEDLDWPAIDAAVNLQFRITRLLFAAQDALTTKGPANADMLAASLYARAKVPREYPVTRWYCLDKIRLRTLCDILDSHGALIPKEIDLSAPALVIPYHGAPQTLASLRFYRADTGKDCGFVHLRSFMHAVTGNPGVHQGVALDPVLASRIPSETTPCEGYRYKLGGHRGEFSPEYCVIEELPGEFPDMFVPGVIGRVRKYEPGTALLGGTMTVPQFIVEELIAHPDRPTPHTEKFLISAGLNAQELQFLASGLRSAGLEDLLETLGETALATVELHDRMGRVVNLKGGYHQTRHGVTPKQLTNFLWEPEKLVVYGRGFADGGAWITGRAVSEEGKVFPVQLRTKSLDNPTDFEHGLRLQIPASELLPTIYDRGRFHDILSAWRKRVSRLPVVEAVHRMGWTDCRKAFRLPKFIADNMAVRPVTGPYLATTDRPGLQVFDWSDQELHFISISPKLGRWDMSLRFVALAFMRATYLQQRIPHVYVPMSWEPTILDFCRQARVLSVADYLGDLEGFQQGFWGAPYVLNDPGVSLLTRLRSPAFVLTDNPDLADLHMFAGEAPYKAVYCHELLAEAATFLCSGGTSEDPTKLTTDRMWVTLQTGRLFHEALTGEPLDIELQGRYPDLDSVLRTVPEDQARELVWHDVQAHTISWPVEDIPEATLEQAVMQATMLTGSEVQVSEGRLVFREIPGLTVAENFWGRVPRFRVLVS